MKPQRPSKISLSAIALSTCLCGVALAAQYEMGTGVPSNIGLYSAATGVNAYVWLSDVTLALPAACGNLVLSPATMGMDAYKLAIATLLTAKASNKRVRFYAHAERDGGCGADYVPLLS